MNSKIKKIIAIILFSTPLVTFANLVSTLKPENCPNPGSIKSNLFIAADYIDRDHGWNVFQDINNKYDTDRTWLFAIFQINGKNTDDVFGKAYASLSTLQNPKGPISIMDGWYCKYPIGYGYTALAVTGSNSSISNLKNIIG